MSCPLTPRQSWLSASRFWYPPHCHWRTYTSFHKVIVFGRLQAEIAQGLHDCLTAGMFKQPRVPVLTYWTRCRHAEHCVGRAVALLDLWLGTLLVVGLTTKTEYSGFDPYLLSFHHQNYKMIKLSGFITMQFLQASQFHRYRKYMRQMLYAGQSARPSVPFLSDF